jgi:beta-glucanase (GH16 family)
MRSALRTFATTALLVAAASPASAADGRPRLVAPAHGASVDGLIRLEVAGAAGTRRVSFAVDGRVRDVDRRPPFRFGARGLLDTRRLRPGVHRLTVGVSTRTRTVVLRRRVTVGPARGAASTRPPKTSARPSVSWTTPRDGAELTGVLDPATCAVTVADARAVDRIEFFAGRQRLNVARAAPYGCHWDTRTVADGSHTLTAAVHDTAGRRQQTAVEVSVRNGAPAAGVAGWAQEFDGAAGTSPDPRIWNFDVGGTWGNNTEMQQYTDRPDNASLDGEGNLRITARREDYTGADGVTRAYTSARLNTQHKLTFGYGRLEARIRMPAQLGFLPQFWSLGDDIDTVGWPASGEIDVSEVAGLPDDPASARTTHMHLHSPTADGRDSGVGRRFVSGSRLDEAFHLYAVTWSPGRMEFSFDGVTAGVITEADVVAAGGRWVYDHPHFVVLNVAVGNPWTGPPDALTAVPAQMVVDWIRYHPA